MADLRRGDGPVLHLFSGAGGSADEVAALVAALPGDPTVVVHVPAAGAAAAGTVAMMAAAAVDNVRAAQRHGPYRLLGYSFGGLLALEAGQLLREGQEEVELVGLVDTLFDQRFWPVPLFLRASGRRASVHLRSALDGPPAAAARDLGGRAARLASRVSRRVGRSPGPGLSGGPARSVQEANVAVMNEWRPHPFAGPTTLFTATHADFGCDLAELWRPWLPDLTVRRIDADHHSLLGLPAAVAELAAEIGRSVSAAPRPRVLVATTFRWPGAARLADHLVDVGCTVQGVGPRSSPLHRLPALERHHRMSLVSPLSSLTAALEQSGADLVVPFDDRTRQALDRVRLSADPGTTAGARLRTVLDRSLGGGVDVGEVYSRARLMDVAAAAGVRCPRTVEVRSPADVAQWFGAHPGPAVLKTDGSWGGRGVRVVRDVDAAQRAFSAMSRPPRLVRALKRLVAERDPWALHATVRGVRPAVSVQELIEGRPTNSAVACHDGTTLAAVHVEVIDSVGPTGPAATVRLIDHADMAFAVKSVVSALRLSGLCGLDFVMDPSGAVHLLELNPRATPTAHLVGADGSDLLTALGATLGHELPLPRPAPDPADLVVSLRPPGRPARSTARRRTHFWSPSPRLPAVTPAGGEGGATTVVTTRGSS